MNKFLIWTILIWSAVMGILSRAGEVGAVWSINLADNYVQIGDWTAPGRPKSFNYESEGIILAEMKDGEQCETIVTTKERISLTWEGEEGGEIRWKIAGEEEKWSDWEENRGRIDIKLEEDGEYQFAWQQRDQAGNEGVALEIGCKVVVDRQKPKSEISYFNRDTAGNLGIYYQIEDAGAPQKEVSVYYRFQTKNSDWAGEWMLAGEYENKTESGMVILDRELTRRDGWYQVLTLATDAAGNKEEWPLETAGAKAYQMEARAEELPEVLIEEKLTQREYIVPLSRDDGWWRIYNQEAANWVGAEKGVEARLGSEMLRLSAQASTHGYGDIQLNANTNGFYPRTITLNYQIISNQPEKDLGDIGLVVQTGTMLERVAEIDGSELSEEKIDGWYRTGWQQLQIAPAPNLLDDIANQANNGVILLTMNHELAEGKEAYIYIDKIEFNRVVMNAEAKIRVQNNRHAEYKYVGYEYEIEGEKIASKSAENGDLYLQLARTPDKGEVKVWLENETGERMREGIFYAEIDNEAPKIKVTLEKLEQIGENWAATNQGKVFANYFELVNEEQKEADTPRQNIYYMALPYQNPQKLNKNSWSSYVRAEYLKHGAITGRANNTHAPLLSLGRDKMMMFHYRQDENTIAWGNTRHYYGVFIDTAYNVQSFNLDLESQICTIPKL